jgi:hypothetical protein
MCVWRKQERKISYLAKKMLNKNSVNIYISNVFLYKYDILSILSLREAWKP